MKWINILQQIIYKISLFFQWLAMGLLAFIMIITVIDVIGRYFSAPLLGSFELTNYSLALIVFLGLGMAQINKAHLAVDFLVAKLPKKIQKIIDIAWYIITFMVLVLIGVQMFEYAMRSMGSATAELNLPTSYIFMLSSFGLLIYSLTVLVELLKTVFTRKEDTFDAGNH